MRRWRSALLLGIALALAPAAADAHPLGNFTINHYLGIVVRPDVVLLDYVVDMAEIPAFQERPAIEADPARACRDLADGIRVRLESSPIVGSRPSSPASARRADAIWFKCCSSSIGTACRAKGSRSSKPETRGPKARHEDGRRPDLSVRHDESSPT